MPRDTIDLVVLDTIADDCESMESILDRLNRPGNALRKILGAALLTRTDIVPALLRLVRDGLAEPLHQEVGGLVKLGVRVMPEGDLDEYWFAITPQGLMVHAAWEPRELA
jgi:hypothetical protein